MKKLLFLIPCLLLAGCGSKVLTIEEKQQQAVTTCVNTVYEAITKTEKGKNLQKSDLVFKVASKSCSWEWCTVYWSVSRWEEIKPFSCTTKYDLAEVVQYSTDFYEVWTWEDEIWSKISKQEVTEKETEKKPKAWIEKQNALGSAESYLRSGDFSKERLRQQLEYEWYPKDAIDYALENVEADWMKECLWNAQSHLRSSNFSKQRLREQLEYEWYLKEEIDYAINHIDW